MTHYNYIDVLFRQYGEEHFGPEKMNKITDAQLEQIRIRTMEELTELVKMGHRQPDMMKKILFWHIKHDT